MTKVMCGLALSVAATLACGNATAPPITQLPRELSVAELAIIEADNAFAFSLFRELARASASDDNIVISPLSVAMALAMTYHGSAGETRQAMAEVLHLGNLTVEQVNQGYRDLIDFLRELDGGVDWDVANSIWHDVTTPILPTFLEVNRTFFDADVRSVNFRDGTAAADLINGWVRENTRGRIGQIVQSPIPPNTALHVLNAIYFKGDWTHKFDRGLTQPGPFLLDGNATVTIDFMTHDEPRPLRYVESTTAQIVELPYAREAYTMMVIVPFESGVTRDLSMALTIDQWEEWLTALTLSSVTVTLPRFAVEYATPLKDALTVLGMGTAFGQSDFSGIFGDRGPPIDEINHKTFVEVTEDGTEAAAVTDIAFRTRGGVEVSVTRPFLFVIRERFSGTILFLGRVMNPAE